MMHRCLNHDDGQCPLEARDYSNYCPIHGARGLAGSLNRVERDNQALRRRVSRLEMALGFLIAGLVFHMAIVAGL
jgi:hypothetical protein